MEGEVRASQEMWRTADEYDGVYMREDDDRIWVRGYVAYVVEVGPTHIRLAVHAFECVTQELHFFLGESNRRHDGGVALVSMKYAM